MGDESVPENVLNLDDLTADALAVSYCLFLFLDWDFCSLILTLLLDEQVLTLLHAALWHP